MGAVVSVWPLDIIGEVAPLNLVVHRARDAVSGSWIASF